MRSSTVFIPRVSEASSYHVRNSRMCMLPFDFTVIMNKVTIGGVSWPSNNETNVLCYVTLSMPQLSYPEPMVTPENIRIMLCTLIYSNQGPSAKKTVRQIC